MKTLKTIAYYITAPFILVWEVLRWMVNQHEPEDDETDNGDGGRPQQCSETSCPATTNKSHPAYYCIVIIAAVLLLIPVVDLILNLFHP